MATSLTRIIGNTQFIAELVQLQSALVNAFHYELAAKHPVELAFLVGTPESVPLDLLGGHIDPRAAFSASPPSAIAVFRGVSLQDPVVFDAHWQ